MEYNLNISQKAIHENFPTLDIKDAAIIDFLSRFSHSDSIQKRFHNGKVFYWFDYGKIADENPLLKLDKESIRRRIRNLCSLGIFIPHPENQGGRVFFSFGSEYEKTHKFETEKKHRANLPELKNKTSGRKSRPHRAENPELPPKHRANLPDNHNNHLSLNQLSTKPKKAAAEFLVKTTTEFPNVTLAEIQTVEAKKENPTPVPPTPSPSENRYSKRYDAFDIDLDASRLKEDQICRDRFGRDLKIGLERATSDFPVYVDRFVENQKSETFNYPNTKEFRKHFFNWIPKVYGNIPKEGGATRQTTNGKANLNQWGGDASAYAEPQKF